MIFLCVIRLSTVSKNMMIINYSTSLKALLHDLVGVGRLRPLLNGVERLCPLCLRSLKALLHALVGVGRLCPLLNGVGRLRPLCLRSLKALLQAFKLKTLLQMSKLKALHRVTF